jgi:hypothetical protein
MRARKKADGLKAVSSWIPTHSDTSGGYSSHRVLDARSLAMHVRIVQKIDRDPGLLAIAHRNLARWGTQRDPEPPTWLKEWQHILRQPWPRVAAVMSEQSETACRLRQSSPFAGVLTTEERRKIYEAFRT